MYLSRRVLVLAFTFRSVMHFRIIFVCGVKWRFDSTSHHHLLERLSLPHPMPWCFIEDQLTIKVWVYFGILSSVTLIQMSVPVPIPCYLDYL